MAERVQPKSPNNNMLAWRQWCHFLHDSLTYWVLIFFHYFVRGARQVSVLAFEKLSVRFCFVCSCLLCWTFKTKLRRSGMNTKQNTRATRWTTDDRCGCFFQGVYAGGGIRWLNPGCRSLQQWAAADALGSLFRLEYIYDSCFPCVYMIVAFKMTCLK